ncbi:MAG: class I SAM-dependent methyltransferase [Desulfamplus sp.]
MKKHNFIRQLLTPINRTPIHPQWFAFLHESQSLDDIAKNANGLVLDIGAGAQNIQKFLHSDCNYISLDYYQTAIEWYNTRPQLFGDGQCLPVKTDSVDTVLLLDVLEHLSRP